jgi:hypothetical protein
MTDKQGAADLLLKECDLATDGRLGLVEYTGGTSNAAEFGDANEGLKNAKVHDGSLHFPHDDHTKHSIYARQNL